MITNKYTYLVFVICFAFHANGQKQAIDQSLLNKGQERPVVGAKPSKETSSESRILSDTIPVTESLPISGSVSRPNDPPQRTGIKLTQTADPLPSKVTYGAKDTQWLDVKTNEMHLFGEAHVTFENYKINAGYIVFNLGDDIAIAESIYDEKGKEIGKPTFTDGTQEMTYRKLKYNFKTKKGLVYDVVTDEGEFYLHGKRTKFVSKEADTINFEDRIYNVNTLITTCDHEHPHYGIRTTKLKMIPDRLAVFGPANLEIAGIPTPLFLPFGMFPIAKGRSSGIIFPQDYHFDQTRGFGLKGVGYYFPISDYYDLKLTADIYTRGSYGIEAFSNYKRKYQYSGNLKLKFFDERIENLNDGGYNHDRSFSIVANHYQDAKAHPYRKISGGIHIETKGQTQRYERDYQSRVTNTYSSNFSFKHSLPGSSYNFIAEFKHRQNTNTGDVTITLPDLQFNMSPVFIFKDKNKASSDKKWYEEISVDYDPKLRAFVKTSDSTLFSKQVLKDVQYGISHSAETKASFNVLKHFQFSPRVSYDEIWFFKSLDKNLNPIPDTKEVPIDFGPDGDTLEIRIDSTYNIQDTIVSGFKPYRDLDISASLSTKIFGTLRFSKGWLRGLRHTISPNLSFNYSPDTRERYEEVVDSDPREEFNNPRTYNPFTGGVFSGTGLSEERLATTFSFTNNFEGKYYSKRDSTEKNFSFVDFVTFSGGYNFAADSIKWDPFNLSGRTKLFKKLVSVRFGASFSAYTRDEDNRRQATTVWETRKRLIQLENYNLTISSGFTIEQLADFFKGEKKDDKSKPKQGKVKTDFYNSESLLDLIKNFRLEYNFTLRGFENSNDDRLDIQSHTLRLTGGLKLTKNWDIRFGNIAYDLKNKSFVYPDLTLIRDLHCWRMEISWRPDAGSYSFFIGVKSNTLNFIKYNYGQNRYNSLPSIGRR